MTAKELAEVAKKIHHDNRVYAPDTDRNHDGHGCDTRDHNVFDSRNTEDVFPY